MGEAQRREIDGVPVFTGALPPGFDVPTVGTLIFRVGLADETVARLGLTHMVEHLAMFGVDPTLDMNAYVHDSRTEFMCAGDPDEVSGFFRHVTAALSELPVQRLEAEKHVLESEARQREDTALTHLASVRFGARTYGLLRYHQFGLKGMTAEDALYWAAERFTRGNAVAWISGEVPADVEFRLPAGRRLPPVAPDPLERLEFPVYSDYGEEGAAAGYVVPRGYASSLGFEIAADRLLRRLRTERGITYAVTSEYTRLTADVAHQALVADAADGHAVDVRDELVRVIDELATEGPTSEELRRVVRDVERNLSASSLEIVWLQILAEAELMGTPSPTVEEWRAELAAVDEQVISARMSELAPGMALCAPAGLSPPPPLRGLAWNSRVRDIPPVEGRVYRPRRQGLRRSSGRILVGDDGLSLIRQEPSPVTVTVRYDDCVLVKVLPDGSHVVNSVDESWITVNPARLERADEVIASLRAAVPSQKFVAVDS